MVFKKDDELLMGIAVKNNLDMDKVISGYLIMGEQFLIMLHVFEGQELKVPSKRRLCSPSLRNIRFIEDDERIYEDYAKGQIIEKGDREFTVIDREKKLLNHWYVPVMEVVE